jgi:uncharacterized protein YjiS (DUF1127 family)
MSNRLRFGEPLRLQPQQLLPAARVPCWAMLRSAWRCYRSRQRIPQLDRHLLKDIGVSFAEAEAEANKPFWRD